MALLSVTGAKVPPLLGYLPQLAKADAKGSNRTTSFVCVKVLLVAARLAILAAPSAFPECMESERVPGSQGVVLGSRGGCPTGLGQNDPQKRVTPGASRAEAAGSSGAIRGLPQPQSPTCLVSAFFWSPQLGRPGGVSLRLCCAPLAR